MIGFLILFLHVPVSPFKTQARLEAEIVLIRHQLSVLRQRAPSRPRLTVEGRLLFVWLYRLFPSVFESRDDGVERCHDYQAGDDRPVASDRLPPVLAQEVAYSGRSAEDTRGDPPPELGDEPGGTDCGAHHASMVNC